MALLSTMVMALLMLQGTHAVVYKVGDDAGWTTIGNIDYKHWAAVENFKVGDVIMFLYNPQFHNVMQVTHSMYRACNASAPLATYTTGNDSITITKRGHHYFFCAVPGHCQAGQKVDINVPSIISELAPTPPVSAPSAPSAQVPGPSSSNAMPLKALAKTCFGLAMPILLN